MILDIVVLLLLQRLSPCCMYPRYMSTAPISHKDPHGVLLVKKLGSNILASLQGPFTGSHARIFPILRREHLPSHAAGCLRSIGSLWPL